METRNFSSRVEKIFHSFAALTREIFFNTRRKKLGSFSIDDGNGSENVTFTMNSRFFNLCRVYSNLLKMASVREFPWS